MRSTQPEKKNPGSSTCMPRNTPDSGNSHMGTAPQPRCCNQRNISRNRLNHGFVCVGPEVDFSFIRVIQVDICSLPLYILLFHSETLNRQNLNALRMSLRVYCRVKLALYCSLPIWTYRTRSLTRRPNIKDIVPGSPLQDLGRTPNAKVIHEIF